MLQAQQWWLANHGHAPSRLEADLAEVHRTLAVLPRLGIKVGWRGRRLYRLPLRCGFFVLYLVRPRLRHVVIVRILAGSRLHG